MPRSRDRVESGIQTRDAPWTKTPISVPAMKFANVAGYAKLRDDFAASQALITRTEQQTALAT
jgi:hypothetical protein